MINTSTTTIIIFNQTPLFYGSRITTTTYANEPIKQVFIHSEAKTK
jgi:hypothetical protein